MIRALLVVAFLLSPLSLLSQELTIDDYAHQISELTSRRRTNVHFVNQQTIFHGVQVSNVHVGTGNLTFLRRDLVAPGRVPLIVARVYDSSRQEAGDFGPGWFLAIAETITLSNSSAVLRDETGSEIRFRIANGRLVLERDFPNDFVDLTVDSETIRAKFRDGSKKTYSLIGEVFRLTQYEDRNGNGLDVVYSGARVQSIANATHQITFSRNDQGLIIKAEADSGRKVSYVYDQQGRLQTFRDSGNAAWSYEYEGNNLLKAALDPAQRLSIGAKYGEDRKVSAILLPSGTIRYFYDQNARMTTVIDRKELTSRFYQNAEGITGRVVNALGEDTALELDSANNPIKMWRNGVLRQSLSYDEAHRLLVRTSYGSIGARTRTYQYDPQSGALLAIQNGDRSRSFEHDGKGNLIKSVDAGAATTYGRSPAGDLTAYADGKQSLSFTPDADGMIVSVVENGETPTKFSYQPSGQLASAEFADGRKVTFEYQGNGLRSFLRYADGRRAEYSYDPAGNLTGTAGFDTKGKQRNGQTFVLDESYAILKRSLFDGRVFTFEYDKNGNLITKTEGTKVTRFGYDALDRLITVTKPDGATLTHEYEPGEVSLVDEYGHMPITPSSRVLGGNAFGSNAEAFAARLENVTYGSLRFSERLGTFELPDQKHYDITTPELGTIALLNGTQLLNGNSIPLDRRQIPFMGPINKLFQPAEYASINCCPECFIGSDGPECPDCGPWGGGTPTLISISPTEGKVGQIVNVVLTGTNFDFGNFVDAGSGIFTNITIVDSSTMTGTFTISESAPLGLHSVRVDDSNPKTFRVKPDLTISAAQTIKDGAQGAFSVIPLGTVSSYQWSFTAPSGAGNNPNVTFSPANSDSTTTNGHWFALPNVACPTSSNLPAYYNANYTIQAAVTFTDGSVLTRSSSLTVNSHWNPAGAVNGNIARISGVPAYAPDANNVWRVTGMGTLSRTVPTSATIYVIPTSQFYYKTGQHEQVHVNQWILGPGHLLGDLYIPADFYAQIQNITGVSEPDLINKLGSALTTYVNSQAAIVNQRRPQMEREAYQVSDPIAPQYVYQNCGQY
jgi:YD repeat-containing protein